jgi:probable HAF family extracellular repeat protein
MTNNIIEAFLSIQAGSIVRLGDLPGGSFNSIATGVSDGIVPIVVGYSNANQGEEAFIWDGSNGIRGLRQVLTNDFGLDLRRWQLQQATAISGNGVTIVGSGSNPSGQVVAWIANLGSSPSLIGLGDLPGGDVESYASDVSDDGSAVVGYSQSKNGTEAFRWTQKTGIVGLGDLSGGEFLSIATEISANGSVVVGYSKSSKSGDGTEAFRWTESTGMVGLGDLSGGEFLSEASGVSADGSVVVGYSEGDDGNVAFIWNANGMRNLEQVLSNEFKLNLGGWKLERATGISNDGLTIVGNGSNPNGQDGAWLAKLATASGGGFFQGVDPNNSSPKQANAVSGDGLTTVGKGIFESSTSLVDPVYRFYNGASQGHFFTTNVAERDTILGHPEWGYNSEGVGFKASTAPVAGSNLQPVYRFYNQISQGHFFTINTEEKDNVLSHPEWGYNFEGVGFYAYGASENKASDVYRFYNQTSQGHFFTISAQERDNVLSHPEWGYNFEGVAFEGGIP